MKPTDILHRAKRKDNGEWVEGYYNTNIGNCNHLIRSPEYGGTVLTENKDSYCTFSGKMYIIDPSTLCVWTTLLDKNGKKVFTGDLIQQTNFNGTQYTAIYEVMVDTGSFCLKMHKGNEKAMKDGYLSAFSFEIYSEDKNKLRKGEIIGNIHDNKELIEEI